MIIVANASCVQQAPDMTLPRGVHSDRIEQKGRRTKHPHLRGNSVNSRSRLPGIQPRTCIRLTCLA